MRLGRKDFGKCLSAGVLLVLLVGCFTACAGRNGELWAATMVVSDKEKQESEKFGEDGNTEKIPGRYTFTDDLGREVTVESPERVAALLGSYADVWTLAGGTICAAGEDAWEDFGLDLSEDIVSLGGTHHLNLELLLGSHPDFVLASANTPQQLEWQEALDGAGIPTAYFDVSSFEDYLRMLKICTDITGRPELFEKYGTKVQQEIETVLEHSEGMAEQKVLMMRASAASIRAKNSSGNVLGEMLLDFGCVNIADDDRTLLEDLNVESILLQDPDKIFLIETGDDIEGIRRNVETMFREHPLWQELNAVKNGQVYYMDKQLYNLKPNARWGEAYEKLEQILQET